MLLIEYRSGTSAHAWRFVGIYFLAGAIVGFLPPQFGFPEGLGDIITAIFSLPLAFAIRKNSRSPRLRTAFIAWNVFGLIDLISAIKQQLKRPSAELVSHGQLSDK